MIVCRYNIGLLPHVAAVLLCCSLPSPIQSPRWTASASGFTHNSVAENWADLYHTNTIDAQINKKTDVFSARQLALHRNNLTTR